MPHYLLAWASPTDRLFDIAIRFTAPVDTPRLLLPVWRPGRYLLQNYAANVREWSAGEHRMWKDEKSSWRVDARAGETVEVRYRYYAGVLDAGSSFLDEDEAYFNGSNLFMLVEGLRDEEHRLTVAAPAEWRIETQLAREERMTPGATGERHDSHSRVAPASWPVSGDRLEAGATRDALNAPPATTHMSRSSPGILRSAGDDTSFLARDYDHLIDSPVIAAASLTRHSFVEEGARIHLIFRGDEGIDTEQFVEPVRAIARAQARLFGGFPFREYRFLYHVRDKWHGVEHEDSSSIVARRDALLGATR